MFITTNSNRVPLPIELSSFGMPGCWLRTSVDAAVVIAGQHSAAEHCFTIPNDATPVGVHLQQQALVFDPSRNAVVALHDDGVANQGWSWSGQAWTSLAMGTPVRGGQHLVTDTWRRRLHAVGAAGTLVASQGMWVLGPTPAAVTHHGSGCGAPEPMVTASGKPTPGNAGFELAVTASAAQAPVFLLLGGAAVQQPLGGGCDLQVGVHFATLLALAGATGFAAFALAIPADPILLGFAVETQAATIVANGPAWSSRLQVRIGD